MSIFGGGGSVAVGKRQRIIIFRTGNMLYYISQTATLTTVLLGMNAISFISVMFSFTCSVGTVLQFC